MTIASPNIQAKLIDYCGGQTAMGTTIASLPTTKPKIPIPPPPPTACESKFANITVLSTAANLKALAGIALDDVWGLLLQNKSTNDVFLGDSVAQNLVVSPKQRVRASSAKTAQLFLRANANSNVAMTYYETPCCGCCNEDKVGEILCATKPTVTSVSGANTTRFSGSVQNIDFTLIANNGLCNPIMVWYNGDSDDLPSGVNILYNTGAGFVPTYTPSASVTVRIAWTPSATDEGQTHIFDVATLNTGCNQQRYARVNVAIEAPAPTNNAPIVRGHLDVNGNTHANTINDGETVYVEINDPDNDLLTAVSIAGLTPPSGVTFAAQWQRWNGSIWVNDAGALTGYTGTAANKIRLGITATGKAASAVSVPYSISATDIPSAGLPKTTNANLLLFPEVAQSSESGGGSGGGSGTCVFLGVSRVAHPSENQSGAIVAVAGTAVTFDFSIDPNGDSTNLLEITFPQSIGIDLADVSVSAAGSTFSPNGQGNGYTADTPSGLSTSTYVVNVTWIIPTGYNAPSVSFGCRVVDPCNTNYNAGQVIVF